MGRPARRQVYVCESSSQRIVSVPFAGDGLNVMDKCGDLAFVGIKMNAGPFAELVGEFEKGDHVLHRVGDESSVIRMPLPGRL